MPSASPLRPVLRAITALAIAMTMHACADYDDGPEVAYPTVTNIVTFTGNNPDGMATFDFYPTGAATPLQLVADQGLDSEASDLRCLATYIPASGDQLASGAVTLVSCSLINDIAVEVAPIDRFIDWWDTTPFTVRSLWAAGPYVNLDCLVPYSSTSRELRFYIEKVSDPDSEEEITDLTSYDAYIAQRADTGATFDRQYYISFDLREFIFTYPAADTLRVHINNAADPSRQLFTVIIPKADS